MTLPNWILTLPGSGLPAALIAPGWEDRLKEITAWLATGVEGCAGLIIGLAAVEATLRALRLFVVRSNSPQDAKEQIRLRLGRWLAVALEFELAADILRTAVAPTWNEIGQLVAIATLRTLLNYFLQKEIDKAAERNNIPPADVTKTPSEQRDNEDRERAALTPSPSGRGSG